MSKNFARFARYKPFLHQYIFVKAMFYIYIEFKVSLQIYVIGVDNTAWGNLITDADLCLC